MKKEKVVMVGFKGYSKGLVCSPGNKPKKYKENTVFTEDNASICNNGMHFCANPLSVFQYYPPKNNNEFTTIEALDKCDTDDNVKYCTKKLRVGVKITIPAIIKAGIEFIFEKSKVSDSYSSTSATSGDSSTSAVNGKNSVAVANGNECKVKGVLGCYLVLTEYDHDTDKFFAKMRKVDGKHIKENVYYTLKDGKFKEVK